MKNLSKASLWLIVVGVMMILLPVGCGTSGKTTNKPFTVEHQNCPMKHIIIEYLDEFNATICIDYPVDAPKKLTDSITAFINKTLYEYFDYGEEPLIPYENVYSTDLPHIAEHYWEAYRSFYEQYDPEFHWLDLNLVAQTDTYVTYEKVIAFRWEGIHEYYDWTSFAKNDGHILKEVLSIENLIRFMTECLKLDEDVNWVIASIKDSHSEGYTPFHCGLLNDSLAFIYPDGTGHQDVDKYDFKVIKPYLSKEALKMISGNAVNK